jgi:Na+/H+ antiporter NhaD/arsenite permease-like protein
MPKPPATIKNASQIALFGVICAISGQAVAAGFVDTLADIFSWIAIIIIPIVLGIAYWQIHYLPSKIAEKRQHPQKEAIHAMCMVSRFSGGLFWPIAFVWAHLKPTIVPLSKEQVQSLAEAEKKSSSNGAKE